MLLSISLGAVALVLRLRRSTGQQRLQLRWISTAAAVLAVTFVVFAAQRPDPARDAVDLAGSDVPGLHLLFGERRRRHFPVSAVRHRRDPEPGDRAGRAGGLRHGRLHRRRGGHRRCPRGGRRARIDPVLAVVGGHGTCRGRVPTAAQTRAAAGGSTGLRKPGRALRGTGHAEPAARRQPAHRTPCRHGSPRPPGARRRRRRHRAGSAGPGTDHRYAARPGPTPARRPDRCLSVFLRLVLPGTGHG